MKKTKGNTAPSLEPIRFLFLLLLPLAASLSYSEQVIDPTFLPRLLVGLFALALIAGLLWTKRESLVFPPTDFFSLGLLCYLLWQWLSLSWADTFSEALLEGSRGLLFTGTFYLSYLLWANDRDFGPWLLRSALLGSGIAILIAFFQLSQLDWSDPLALYEVRGIAGHRNLFGAFLLLMLGFQGLATIHLKGIESKIAMVLGGLGLLLILLLQVRSAWMGLLVALLWGLLVLVRSRIKLSRRTVLLAMGIPIGLFLVALTWYASVGKLEAFQQRLDISQYIQSETAVERLRLWNKTWCTFAQQPLLGVGAGNWQTHFADCRVYGLYSVELNDVTYQRPHNDFLWVFSELGILGGLLYLLIFLTPLLMSWQSSRQASNPWPAHLRAMAWLGLVVVSNFSFPKERPELLIWMAILLSWIYWQWHFSRTDATISKVPHYFVLGALLLLSLGGIYLNSQRVVGERAMKQVYRYKNEGQWPALIKAADQAYSPYYTIDPNAIPVHWYRGIGHFAQGQFQKAQADYEQALQFAPYSQHCWNDLGSCLEKLGQRSKAREAYQEALRISPLFDDPKVNLAVLGYKDQDYYNALYWLDQMRDSTRAQPYREVIQAALKEQQ